MTLNSLVEPIPEHMSADVVGCDSAIVNSTYTFTQLWLKLLYLSRQFLEFQLGCRILELTKWINVWYSQPKNAYKVIYGILSERGVCVFVNVCLSVCVSFNENKQCAELWWGSLRGFPDKSRSSGRNRGPAAFTTSLTWGQVRVAGGLLHPSRFRRGLRALRGAAIGRTRRTAFIIFLHTETTQPYTQHLRETREQTRWEENSRFYDSVCVCVWRNEELFTDALWDKQH